MGIYYGDQLITLHKLSKTDIAFRIQLGIILPKLEEKLSAELSTIVEDLANIIKAGTLSDALFPWMK